MIPRQVIILQVGATTRMTTRQFFRHSGLEVDVHYVFAEMVEDALTHVVPDTTQMVLTSHVPMNLDAHVVAREVKSINKKAVAPII